MQNDAATLYCPNDLCQAPNPLNNKFCQQCRTPLLKPYLWAVADGMKLGTPGEILADRYLVISNHVVVDTKPGLLPDSPTAEAAQAIRPYLRLIPYRLHLPEAYGVLRLADGRSQTEVILLEQAPIYSDGTPTEGQLMPELTDVWKVASSMRQLNWLWQMASLWQPMSSEGVASSLLDSQLLRVEGPLVRLLQLRYDQQTAPTLAQLGRLWSQLLPATKPAIAAFVEQLCQQLIQGEIHSSEQLIAVLDRGLTEVGRSQPSTIRIATKSDTGPSRQRNEDACYPPSGNVISKPPHSEALAIVCDGIGGHEGGNVASNLAIETIQQQVHQILKVPREHIDPSVVLADLEQATAAANDIISQRNDSEKRQGRQRMGTTLVMALGMDHEMYIAHVGDSRAYWITRQGCHQVTLDDDVASREVRLGYAIYRDAVQQVSSGSLVQALGMSASASLHPTAQRFVLDEDGVFLLCSDGLSDFDRVEQCWETEIVPILDGKIDLATATGRLVQIANTYNGHDNVTVGLVHYQIQPGEPKSTLPGSIADLASIPARTYSPTLAAQSATTSAQLTAVPTQILPSSRRKGGKLPLLLGILLLLGIGGGVLAYLWQEGLLPITLVADSRRVQTTDPTVLTEPAAPTAAQSPLLSSYLDKGSLIKNKSEVVLSKTALTPSEGTASTAQDIQITLPAGSVMEVIDKQAISAQDYWLHLRVCSIATTQPTATTKNLAAPSPTPATSTITSTTTTPSLPPGTEGWIRLSAIQPQISYTWKSADLNQCAPGNASVTPVAQPSVQPQPPKPAPQGNVLLKPDSSQTQSGSESKTR